MIVRKERGKRDRGVSVCERVKVERSVHVKRAKRKGEYKK